MKQMTIPWTIEIDNLETQSRVGVWEHEQALQPLRIDLSIRAASAAFPQIIEDCLNYESVCRWILDEWPRQPHTPLLETRARELMDFVFGFDARVEWASLALFKTRAISQVRAVGIRISMSRSEYAGSFGSRVFVPSNKADCALTEASIGSKMFVAHV